MSTTGQGASPVDLTGLLQAWSGGDDSALERLTPVVYAELHRLAHLQMAGERQGHVLQPSALVNEAFVRLMGAGNTTWANRSHFYAASARLMRQILVDFARHDSAQKRGARAEHVDLEGEFDLAQPRPAFSPEQMLAIDHALSQLEQLDKRQASIVELRFFGGLDTEEIAAFLNISVRTVAREWRLARAFLYRALGYQP